MTQGLAGRRVPLRPEPISLGMARLSPPRERLMPQIAGR
jgi:hypothetical protein